MRIAPPDIPAHLETALPFEEAVTMAQAYDAPLEGCGFSGADASGTELTGLDVRACTFAGMRFTGTMLGRASFRGVRFTGCDFSAVRGMQTSFTRCAFEGCKLAGANLAAGAWNDVTLHECRMEGTVLAESLLKNVCFTDCVLTRAVLSDLRPRSAFLLERCDLRAAEFCHTPLKGHDLTECDIDGIVVTDGVLQGAVVTPVQACELAKLLGVTIRD